MKRLSLVTNAGHRGGEFVVCGADLLSIGANTESENGPLDENTLLVDASDANAFAVT